MTMNIQVPWPKAQVLYYRGYTIIQEGDFLIFDMGMEHLHREDTLEGCHKVIDGWHNAP